MRNVKVKKLAAVGGGWEDFLSIGVEVAIIMACGTAPYLG